METQICDIILETMQEHDYRFVRIGDPCYLVLFPSIMDLWKRLRDGGGGWGGE